MNASINCHVSLSKKLRALMGKEGSITLIVSEFKDGLGDGNLSISGENIDFDKDIFEGETSIQIEPVGKMQMEVGGEDQACSNIFSSTPNKGHSEKVVSKIAVVNAPERTEVSTAIKTKEQINTEASISKTVPPSAKKWIADMEQLLQVVNKAKNKRSNIDIDSAQTDREKAVLMQMKEKEEAIDTEAWIINDKFGNLSINDLGIAMPMNVPYDLGFISARRLAASIDLKTSIRDGLIRFISPKEKDHFIQKSIEVVEGIGSLPVFDRHEEAMASIESADIKNPVIGEDAIEVTAADIDNATEEEESILNLTQSLPLVKEPRSTSEAPAQARHTVHGTNSSVPKAVHKPVARKE